MAYRVFKTEAGNNVDIPGKGICLVPTLEEVIIPTPNQFFPSEENTLGVRIGCSCLMSWNGRSPGA